MMTMKSIEALGASFLVSLISLVGVCFVPVFEAFVEKKKKKKKTDDDDEDDEDTKRISFVRELSLFGSGALLADAATHAIPSAFKDSRTNEFAGIWFLSGALSFYALDLFIRKRLSLTSSSSSSSRDGKHRNHHHHHYSSIDSSGWLNLFADALHNFTDGVALAVSFKSGNGIAKAFALAAHELPQEIGDYGVLRVAGFSHWDSLAFNFLSALMSMLGTAFAWYIGAMSEKAEIAMESFTASGFIFVAISQIVSSSSSLEAKSPHFIKDFVMVLLGVLVVIQVHGMFACCSDHDHDLHEYHHHHHHHNHDNNQHHHDEH
jgi:zinc and cadmium transporter